MADLADPKETARPGLRKLLLIGAVAGLALGAGGWFAIHSGLLGGAPKSGGARSAVPDVAFLPVPAMVISLAPGSRHKHLRFSTTLEVGRSQQGQVETMMPRVVDVLNSYLRAIDVAAFEEPAALFRLRAQMLRRVQLVTGDGAVRDLLITEFVFN
jgi:flagellar FliL protein